MGETVAAADIVDLMNLLATWTPIVQTAMACGDAAERWKKDNPGPAARGAEAASA